MSRLHCMDIAEFCNIQELVQSTQNSHQLLSIKALTTITSIASTLNETCFMGGVFNIIKDNQKQCAITQDQIYVKNPVISSWNFGGEANDFQSLVKSVLGVMISLACAVGPMQN